MFWNWVAYKVYSEILQAYLWIGETDRDMHSLREHRVTEAIYTNNERKEFKKLSREDLKEIYKVKEVFEKSKIEEINRKTRELKS